ncbi:MAG: ABC transporter ATP-binding protein [Gammaproteobacteria bacterium]
MSVIETQALCKNYRDVHALDGFDLTVGSGQIVGLIGPNGSGKTTAIKTILGLCPRKSGHLSVFGMDPAKHRAAVMRRTAYIADTGILPRWMKIADLVDCFEGLHPTFKRHRFDEALKDTEIRRGNKVQTLSKGMNVQLHLALILAIDAELLVLDEPTLGLDQIYRQRFYHALVNDYSSEERSILVTTHEVREIEHLLTDVVFIHHGRNVLDLSMHALDDQFQKLTTSMAQADAARAQGPLWESSTLHGVEFIFRTPDKAALMALGEVTTPNLAELFVAVVEAAR